MSNFKSELSAIAEKANDKNEKYDLFLQTLIPEKIKTILLNEAKSGAYSYKFNKDDLLPVEVNFLLNYQEELVKYLTTLGFDNNSMVYLDNDDDDIINTLRVRW